MQTFQQLVEVHEVAARWTTALLISLLVLLLGLIKRSTRSAYEAIEFIHELAAVHSGITDNPMVAIHAKSIFHDYLPAVAKNALGFRKHEHAERRGRRAATR